GMSERDIVDVASCRASARAEGRGAASVPAVVAQKRRLLAIPHALDADGGTPACATVPRAAHRPPSWLKFPAPAADTSSWALHHSTWVVPAANAAAARDADRARPAGGGRRGTCVRRGREPRALRADRRQGGRQVRA